MFVGNVRNSAESMAAQASGVEKGRFSKWILPIAKSVSLIAVGIFLLASMPRVEAGPIAYASCMAGCAAVPPVCAAGGWAACLAVLAAPTP